jgi:hypothetical protein
MTKLKAFKKSLLEIVAYRKKYSFPDKVITKKMGALEKLAKLLKPGRSKIYLSDIKENYARAYLSTPGHEYTKSYMKRLGFTALLDLNNRLQLVVILAMQFIKNLKCLQKSIEIYQPVMPGLLDVHIKWD